MIISKQDFNKLNKIKIILAVINESILLVSLK